MAAMVSKSRLPPPPPLSSRSGSATVYIASSKHSEGWENSRQLCKPETLLFLPPEKIRGAESRISAIRNKDDVVVSKLDEICSVCRSFYSIFSLLRRRMLTFLLVLLTWTLYYLLINQRNVMVFWARQIFWLCVKIRLMALMTCLSNWDDLGSDLTDVLSEAYHTDSLSETQKISLITLIHEKGRLNCKNRWIISCEPEPLLTAF